MSEAHFVSNRCYMCSRETEVLYEMVKDSERMLLCEDCARIMVENGWKHSTKKYM